MCIIYVSATGIAMQRLADEFQRPLGLISLFLFVCAFATAALSVAARKDFRSGTSRKTVGVVEIGEPGGRSGIPAGTISIDYKSQMRIDEDALLEVVFTKDANASSPYAQGGAKDASISVNASSLTVRPEPTTYKFDATRVMSTGIDKHIWIINASKSGDFFITVRCSVPKQMYARALVVNGKSLNDGAEVSLPVNVYTPVISSTWISAFAHYAGPILSFLLTLPLLSVILTWYLERRRGSDAGNLQS